MAEIQGLPFDAERLPHELQLLVPLLAEWAISDDVERARRIERAPADDLEHLIADVRPQLGAIDEFIEKHGSEGDAYEAPILGSLAEAAIEAEQELAIRAEPGASATRTCPRCKGEALRWIPHPEVEGGWIPEICPECVGTGRVRA